MLNNKVLNSFSLTMIAIVAIIDLRGIPLMASYGLAAIFFYSVGALLFLIPSGLVCAELSTNLSEAGGMYTWVRHAFGDKFGFLAIWLEWLNNVVSYPASLSFIVITFAYLFDPHFAEHKVYVFIMTLFVLWITTIFSFLGIRASSRLSTVASLFGVILPALVIAVLGCTWVLKSNPVQINLQWKQLIPNFHQINIAFFASTLLGYAGMQVIAFHSQNVKNPLRDYPRSILFSMIIIFFITVGASLAVSVVVPHDQLNLITGLADGFNRFFTAFNVPWATPILLVLILLSAFATLSTWFLGPARGLAVAAQNGFLPIFFAQTNKKQAPHFILILQGIIAGFFCAVFLFMPDVSSGFWLLMNLSSQSTLIMYALIFSAAIKRRYLQNSSAVNGAYKIPGGKGMIWLVAGMGILACISALIASVIPPKSISSQHILHYELILGLSNFVFLSIPFGICYFSRRARAEFSY